MFWQAMTVDIHEDDEYMRCNERVINECRSEGEGLDKWGQALKPSGKKMLNVHVRMQMRYRECRRKSSEWEGGDEYLSEVGSSEGEGEVSGQSTQAMSV